MHMCGSLTNRRSSFGMTNTCRPQSPLPNLSITSFIGCFHFFIAFFLSLVSGKLADLGYFRSTIMGGSLLFTVSLFLLSILSEEDYGKVGSVIAHHHRPNSM